MTETRIEAADEPETPRWVEWRLVIYPVALGAGALAAAFESALLFVLFVVLMLAPIWIKWQAWGGVSKALKWLFKSNLKITREGYLFATLVVLFGIAAVNTGTNLLYLILGMLLSLMLISSGLAKLNLHGLKISRRLPHYVFAGEEFRIRIALTNPRRRLPAFAVEARERRGPFGPGGASVEGPPLFFFSLEPFERKTLAFAGRVPRRGVYPLEGFSIATRFPFGFAVQYIGADLEGEIVAFPAPRELSRDVLPRLGSQAEFRRSRALPHSPEEFRSLREYRAGDNPRWIHWKSSARRGELLVKEFEPRTTRRSAVVLDAATGEGPEAIATLDRGCTLAASLTERLVEQGERPEVGVPAGGEVHRYGVEAGPREVAAMLECLARLAPGPDPDLALVIAAAARPLRQGARVYVLTARDPSVVRRALERAEPGAAFAVDVLSFASEPEVERLYAPAAAGARGRRRKLGLGGDGSGAGGADASRTSSAQP